MNQKKVTRLYPLNLRTEYPDARDFISSYNIPGKAALLQKDYGKANDCTLTSLTFILQNLRNAPNTNILSIYSEVEEVASKYGYNGDKNGTNPFMIRKIMSELNHSDKAKCAKVKGIGFNYKKIQDILKKGHYIILNMASDGRGYYKNHSVTVIGWHEYKNHKFLAIYDNWSTGVSYIDYDRLSYISSINWYE